MVIAKLFIWLVIASEVIISIIDEESIFIAMNLYFPSACLRFIPSLSARITLNIRKWCMQIVLFAFHRNLISFGEWWRNHCRWRKLNYALWKVKKRIPSAFQDAFEASEWSVLRETSRVSRLETNFYLIYRFQTQHFIECRLKASTTMPATKGTESS